MQLKLVSALVLLSFSLGQSALANFPGAPPAIVPPPHVNVVTITPSQPAPETHLMGPDHQFFEFNVSGLRDYLDSIQVVRPKLYAELLPEVERLEAQRTTGRWVMVGGGLVAIFGVSQFFGFGPNVDTNGLGSSGNGTIATGVALYLVGVSIIGAGYYYVLPDRKDLLRVLNKHNSANPEHAIRLQLGLAPVSKGGMVAGLHFQF